LFFFFQAEDGIRDFHVTGVQTCALPIFNDIYVAEEARRQLVADNLIRTAKKMAKETNAVRMRVSTSSNNEVARKTYESIGFKERSEERRVGKECRSGWAQHHRRNKAAPT